jgi:hypothetical protein
MNERFSGTERHGRTFRHSSEVMAVRLPVGKVVAIVIAPVVQRDILLAEHSSNKSPRARTRLYEYIISGDNT